MKIQFKIENQIGCFETQTENLNFNLLQTKTDSIQIFLQNQSKNLRYIFLIMY